MINTLRKFSIQSRDGDCPSGNSAHHAKRKKSLKCTTLESLPKESHYRNLDSIVDGRPRPTLDELHDDTLKEKGGVKIDLAENRRTSMFTSAIKFGWIEGVYIKCLLNIWSTMLFLRLTWVVGQAGIIQGLALITVAHIITTVTTLSMSAVATNGQVKAGGLYFLISRSLGPHFGAAIGLVFTVANIFAVGVNAIGFCDAFKDLLWFYFDVKLFEDGLNDTRVYGSVTLILLLILAIVGMDWIVRVEMGLLVLLIAAQINYLAGVFVGPSNYEEKSMGFLGIDGQILQSNLASDYRLENGIRHTFFSVFAVFFPAVTGIVAGANISGDLANPGEAIPKGTLWAILTTYLSYMIFPLLAGASTVREASGNVTVFNTSDPDIYNPAFTNESCWQLGDNSNQTEGLCKFGMINDYQAMALISAWGPLIYMGCFAASLSSALSSLVGAPRVLQALAKDKLYPGLDFFAVGWGRNNDPVRGYFLTFFISFLLIMVGDLNVVSVFSSNFFLVAYALVNFSCFHASLVKSPGWRPSFKFYSQWVSLLGGIMCCSVMFLIDAMTALLTFVIILVIYIFMLYRKPVVNWGSSTQGQIYVSALKTVIELNNVEEHIKNYRPQLLVFSGSPAARPSLLVGLGKLQPNVVLLGYKADWNKCKSSELLSYFNTIHKAFDMYFGVAILRVANGLDFSEEIGAFKIPESPKLLALSPSRELCKLEEEGSDVSPSRTPEITRSTKDVVQMACQEKTTQDYVGPDGEKLSKEILSQITCFQQKQKGTIDVWWLYDDGGLTLLLPYILNTRSTWKSCKLRVFALGNHKNELASEQRSMASLLAKFRIDFSDLQILSDLSKPSSVAKTEFNELIKNFMEVDDGSLQDSELTVSEGELLGQKEKTDRYIMLKELLHEKSKNASLVVMTLPMPRKKHISAPLYMAWLETLTRDMPPFLFVRGNQTSVLTFYS